MRLRETPVNSSENNFAPSAIADFASDTPLKSNQRFYLATLLIQLALSATIFRIMGNFRLMDPDEGHFLSAVRNVYEGLVPSRDFFFQQMPLFPYPYAASMWLFGYGYEPCIWVSVACGAALAVVVSAWFIRFGGGVGVGWIGWLLVMLNAPILFWVPTVKNHSMPLFFGALALYAAFRQIDSLSAARLWGAVAGFSALLAVGTRLLALPFAMLAGTWLLLKLLSPATRQTARSGLYGFALGAILPVLLMLRSLFPDPWVFYFNNIGFHAIRSGDLGALGSWRSISNELHELLLQGQLPALLIIAICLSGWIIVSQLREPPASESLMTGNNFRLEKLVSEKLIPVWLTICGIGATLLALLPAQTFHQYFLIPSLFFLLAGAPFWKALRESGKLSGIAVPVILLLLYGGFPCNGSIALFNHREWVFPRFPKEFAYKEVLALSRALEEVTVPEDTVMTTWQGFSFLARRKEFPGNENFNARIIAGKLPPEQLKRLHIATNEELAKAIRAGEPKAIVLGFFSSQYREVLTDRAVGASLSRDLLENYQLVRQSGSHALWVRKQGGN